MLGLDYTIQYRKVKENTVVDVLLRREETRECQAISMVVPDWIKEVSNSYEQTSWAGDLMT